MLQCNNLNYRLNKKIKSIKYKAYVPYDIIESNILQEISWNEFKIIFKFNYKLKTQFFRLGTCSTFSYMYF